MAKKKDSFIEKFLNSTLDDIMSDRFGSYSKYIIQERALPDARDGLKPVQRRILYTMYTDGNTYEKAHRKSAKTVGNVMGTLHPHGDSSIYEAMVRMSQDWKINVPLVDMHGNNGSIDDDPPAAYRYTEARLAKNASLILEDIDKNTVTMTNNYDDTLLEPTVLPARYPLLLVNGSTGIASGYATNIAPHNLNEVVNATIYRLENPDCSIDDLMHFIKGPDFPTGGIVQGIKNIKGIFETGKGKVVLRSKCEITESKTNRQIIVTEIPYEVVKSSLVKKISDLYLSKELEGISDVRDESGRNGLRIVIDIKNDFDPNLILNYLYKNTDLQINYNYNCIAIVDHTPTLMSLSAALDAFIEHRKQVVLNRSVYLRDKKVTRVHIIEGLIKAISILDSVIEIIRRSKDKKDAKTKLCEAFLFTDEQAEAIVNLRLYRLTSTDVTVLKEEYATLNREINELNAIINSYDVLKSVLVKELKEVNELEVTPRKTAIEDEVEEIVIDKLSMIPNEECYVSVSRDGYIKRFSERAYMANENSLPFTKDGDFLVGVKKCETLNTLLLFTNKGYYAYLPVYKIDECKFKDLGKHVSSYIKMEGQEKIVGAILVPNFDSFTYIVTLTKNGMIKKSLLPKWDVQRTSKSLTAMKLKDDDELVDVKLAFENDDVIIVSRTGYYNRYSLSILSDLAVKAQGVGAISCKSDEAVSLVIDNKEGKELLLCADNGSMKRIHINELPLTNRNVKGNRLFKQTKTNPRDLVYATMVSSYSSYYVKEKELYDLDIKDVPFMDVNSTFSSVLKLGDYYSLISKDNSDILVAEIVDFPLDYEKKNEEEEQTVLF